PRDWWRMWLMAVGETGIDSERGSVYQHSNLVLLAAEQGDGVAIARSVLAADALASGRLVKPFEVTVPAEYAYYVVCPPAYLERPKVKAFRAWLFEEAEASEAGHH
ncbi:MAG: LysR substrate-binding domain-containing protein, partial [Geminicoccaceae bacterium]